MKEIRNVMPEFLFLIFALIVFIALAKSDLYASPQQARSPEDYNRINELPTPTPLPLCPYSSLNFTMLGWYGSPEQIYVKGSADSPQCVEDTVRQTVEMCSDYLRNSKVRYLQRIFDQGHESCSRHANSWSWLYGAIYNDCMLTVMRNYSEVANEALLDDCVADSLFGFSPTFRIDERYQAEWELTDWVNRAVLNDYYCRYSRTAYFRQNICAYHSGSVYLDRQCQPVDSALVTGSNSCNAGTIYAMISTCPISLIFEESDKYETDPVMVRFPLNPGRPDDWHLWRASAEAPLLVYDPEHSGKITSASQLFGNWTFGGSNYAKATNLNSKDYEQSAAAPWRDGFQALATLDVNGDKKISMAELEPLGLWFDENRDAISQVGEVRSMKELGIKSLFFDNLKVDSQTKDIIAEVGFERVVDGEIVVGKAIDWWTLSGSSRAELLDKYRISVNSVEKKDVHSKLGLEKFGQDALAEGQRIVEGVVRSNSNNKLTDKAPDKRIAGFWKWESIDPFFKGDRMEGYLSFVENSEQDLSGHSYGVINPGENKHKVAAIVRFASLYGRRYSEGDDRVKFKFTINSPEGSVVENEAVFDVNSQSMFGVSKVMVSYGTKPVDIEYKWTAERFTE